VLPLLGTLITLFFGLLSGYYVGRTVQDEVLPSAAYLPLVMDTLLLIMTSLLFIGIGWGLTTVLVIVLLIMTQKVVSLHHAPVSGALIAASMFLQTEFLVTIAILALVLNYLGGLLENSFPRSWVQQPVTAAVTFTLILLMT